MSTPRKTQEPPPATKGDVITPEVLRDRMRRHTPARLRMAADGSATPLDAVLDFQASHARARDAIQLAPDWPAIEAALAPLPILPAHSAAPDRETYVRRPDLGRTLADDAALPVMECDLCIVLGDGLSSSAISGHGPALVHQLWQDAEADGLRLAPVVTARQARVALGDAIGAALGARLVIMLIGERPGLSVSNSLGAYLTYAPRIGTPDSARNCLSNIHGSGGLSVEDAAIRLRWLRREAIRRNLSGVALKDDSRLEALPGAT